VPDTICDGLRSHLGRLAIEGLRRERAQVLRAS